MKKLILISVLLLQGCWAPRCPLESCRVRHEHAHGDLVTGIFSGPFPDPPRIHFLWEGNKGTKNPDAKFQPNGAKKQKARKKFPWERW